MKKLALCVLMALGLSACGGGDKAPAGPNMAYVFDAQKPFAKHVAVKDYSMDHVVVDGKRFDLNKDVKKFNGNAPKYFMGDDQTIVNKKDWLQYTRIGNVYLGNKDDRLFYVGYTTDEKSMPNKGLASYQGYAIEAMDWSERWYGSLIKINVDFAKKEMEARYLKNDGVTDDGFMFEADIKGAYFEGDRARGMFFGPNADEIGGVHDYTSSKGEHWTGVFGARKK